MSLNGIVLVLFGDLLHHHHKLGKIKSLASLSPTDHQRVEPVQCLSAPVILLAITVFYNIPLFSCGLVYPISTWNYVVLNKSKGGYRKTGAIIRIMTLWKQPSERATKHAIYTNTRRPNLTSSPLIIPHSLRVVLKCMSTSLIFAHPGNCFESSSSFSYCWFPTTEPPTLYCLAVPCDNAL